MMTRDLIGVALGPAVGFAVDRYGPRFLMTGSAIMMGISIMLLSQTQSLWQFVLFFGVNGAFGVPGLGYGVLSPTLAKWFIRKRGRATGIATAGLNIGAVATTPLILLSFFSSTNMGGARVLPGVRALDRGGPPGADLVTAAAGGYGPAT